MNRAIFLSSFFSIHWKGSKFFTSPAILQSNPVVSKCVIGAMPLHPATRFRQLSSVPMPSAQTNPTPVTTTRRVKVSRLPVAVIVSWLLTLGVFVDVLDGVFHRGHFLGVFIGDFDAEGLLKRHYQFYLIERIGPKVVHKRRRGRHFRFVHAELLDDNLLHAFFYAGHPYPPRFSISVSAILIRLP